MSTMDDIRVGLKVTVDEAQQQAVNQIEGMASKVGTAVSLMSTKASVMAGIGIAGIAGVGAAMIATVGAASRFEDSFAGIKKTVNATDIEFDKLAANIRSLAVDIPIATSQLNAIGEVGGQLGISAAGLTKFIDTIAKVGVATRLSTESAALGLARLREIFQLSENDFDNLASTLISLGNNFAAIEDEILNTALRLAAGGKIAGATAQDVLGLATALQAVGVQSQAGGTALSRVFQQIRVASTTGGIALQTFAETTGLTTEQFKELADTDAAGALNQFLIGLQAISDSGGNTIQILEDLGLKQQRTIRALLSLAEAGDLVTRALVDANTAYAANIALNDEAAKRFETFRSQSKLLKNSFEELRIEIGTFFLPAAKAMVQTLTAVFRGMDTSDENVKGFSGTVGGLAVIITGLSVALALVLPAIMLLKINATAAGTTVKALGANMEAFAGKTLVSTDILMKAKRAVDIFKLSLLGVTTVLTLFTIAYGIHNRRQEKLIAGTKRFIEVSNVHKDIINKLADAENRYNAELDKGEGANETRIKLITAEIEKYKELEKQLATTQLQSFFDLSKAGAISDTEAQQIIAQFEKVMGAVSKMTGEGNLGREFGFKQILMQELSIDDNEAQQLIDQGLGALLSRAQLEVIRGNKDAMDVIGRNMKQLANIIGDPRNLDSSTEFIARNREELEKLVPYASKLEKLGKAFDTSRMSSDMQMQVLEDLVKKYNEANELTGSYAFTVEDVINSTELMNSVIQLEIDALTESTDKTKTKDAVLKEISERYQDIDNKVENYITTLKQLDDISITSGDSIVAGFDRMNDRIETSNFLMASLVAKGFPALAESVKDMPVAERIGYLVGLLQQSNVELGRMEEGLLATGKFDDLIDADPATLKAIIDTLVTDIDAAANSEAVKNTFGEIALANRENELNVLKEIVDMQDSNAQATEAIAQATENLRDLTRDIVVSGERVTQNQIRQLELKEAQQAYEEAIYKYGVEGVVTSSEQLDLLQATLNIDRMRDKLSEKMTAREKKRIRDKEKEVKFLELAVEQGVAEQLDLDAAKEELEDLKKPLSDTEREILELQLEIAEAEKKVLEERIKSISPEVISAMENVIKKQDNIAQAADDIAEAERAVASAIAEANIQMQTNGVRLSQLRTEYPKLQGMIKELADSIGIPAEITQGVLVSMERSYAQFEIEKQKFMDAYTEMEAFINQNPIVATVEFDYKGYDPEKGLIIGGIQVIPPAYQSPEYTQRSGGITNMFGNPDLYFGRYAGGVIPMGRTSIVGEAGPEKVMSLRGGGSMVFPNKTGGGGNGITVDNMNINITGLPADPITARKVALNIRKELTKLEKEGNAGTGLLNR